MLKKNRQKNILISPSGNLYGSERVLLDYLSKSKLDWVVYLPCNSKLKIEIEKIRVELLYFKSVKILYLYLFFKLFFDRDILIYLNESGHIKYIKILAFIFPRSKFFSHVRILEDVQLINSLELSKNIKLIAISNFVKRKLTHHSQMVFDPYPFRLEKHAVNHIISNKLFVGIIGRVTESKGSLVILDLLNEIRKCADKPNFKFIFYGEILDQNFNTEIGKFSKDLVELKGFVGRTSEIYENIDCVLHLAINEPLGRVFFEAIDYNLPFVGINSGGIGEIAELFDLQDLIINPKDNLTECIIQKLSLVERDFFFFQQKIERSKEIKRMQMSVSFYSMIIDKIIKNEY